jgi:hypothetical protein
VSASITIIGEPEETRNLAHDVLIECKFTESSKKDYSYYFVIPSIQGTAFTYALTKALEKAYDSPNFVPIEGFVYPGCGNDLCVHWNPLYGSVQIIYHFMNVAVMKPEG